MVTDGYEVCTRIPPVLYTKGPVLKLKFIMKTYVNTSPITRLYGEANKFKMEVFTNEWLFGSDSVKYKPTTRVSYSWLHRYQQHPPTHVHWLLMIFIN